MKSDKILELKGNCYGNSKVYENEDISVNCEIMFQSESILLNTGYFYAIKLYKTRNENRNSSI